MTRLNKPVCAFIAAWVLWSGTSCASNPYSNSPLAQSNEAELNKTFESQKPDAFDQELDPGMPSAELLMSQPEFVPEGLGEESVRMEQLQRAGPRFTLSAKDADIKNILMALSKGVRQNIIIDPDIQKKVTVDLKDVTISEALENVLAPLHLDYKFDGKFIRVFKRKMETRMFRMNYIVSQRAGASTVQSMSGTGTSGSQNSVASGFTGGAGGNFGGGFSGNSSGNNQNQQNNRTSTQLVTSERNDLWREIFFGLKRIVAGKIDNIDEMNEEKIFEEQRGRTGRTNAGQQGNLLGNMLGLQPPTAQTEPLNPDEIGSELPGKDEEDKKRQDSYFSINRQAGVVIVHHYPDVLLEVAEFLEAIEGSVQRQVFIQAKILEVNLSDEYRLGVDWSQVSPLKIIHDSDPDIFQGLTPGPGQPFNFSNSGGSNSTLGTMIAGAGGIFYGLSNTQISVLIDALSDQGNVSVLSSPKIATLNNQRAVIKVGTEDIFFMPVVIPATTTQASATQFIPSQITIGIVLDVLPQINMDGTVMMSINTSVSERSGERVSPDGQNRVPVLDVRESNNVVMAKSGQTIVIGGLMKNTRQRDNNELPFLGKIPLLGKLFQYEANRDEKTELVIILTPKVMVGLSIDERLKKEQDRFNQFLSPMQSQLMTEE
ncbi:secretin and TonB N-terminal domain-containing protein [Nitrospina watsonii]|uniref:MSHA biogenesis protein MshL n=1 Tax=Nitrospina watsonii TaxID=1323948 RepID=A0ABM9HGB1_9BACT|nr:secretin and TonB N-terminal domain-containing protein [Nitrospina watsonii]CAI2719243.1 MSHA biogenesis protein MshL [Nitrospina watsonii]